jgi:UDP-N-acetylglucosamine--N-acetylmuramyl-(pentapeptide) pyrophosphoryl-undecaprenol N-acetylglucosamine transferase
LKPALVVGAGSYVSVPVGLAAWLLRIPLFIHQLDIQPGLANKILAFFAVKISVSFEPALKSFSEQKAILTGCPVREEIMVGDRLKAKEMLNLEDGLPTVLAIGGGTGSLRMNQIIIGALPELLSFCQVIHITGRNKKLPPLALKGKEGRYHCFEFVISELPDIMAAADLVITRGGIGFLSELSALGKPSLIIPLPDSHQVVNANYFSSRGAAVALDQETLSSQSLVADIKELLSDKSSLRYLSQKMFEVYNSQAADLLADQVLKIVKDNEV